MGAVPNVKDLIRVSNAKLGKHKGHSRLYIQGKYLSKAGFEPSQKLKMIINQDSIELIVSENGTTTISKKVKGENVIPVIDILSDDLKRNLGSELEIRVHNQSIILKPSRIERAKSLRENSEDQKRCGSLFAGGGLLSQAAKMAGYSERFAVEIDSRYADVYSDNYPESMILNQSVHEVNLEDIPDIDLLLAGIPCQPYCRSRRSGKGYEKGSVPESHELGDMTYWTLRIIEYLAVERGTLKSVVIEEAPDYLNSGSAKILIHVLERIGFNVKSEVMDSKEYGSIQSRNRSVIVATQEEYSFPAKSTCRNGISNILEKNREHDWFDRNCENKKWLYSHWDKQTAKGNNFANGLIKKGSDTNVQAIKKRYFAGQGDNPVLVNESGTKHRWFTLKEVQRMFELPEDYILNVPKTIAGEILGQGVVVGLFKQVIMNINTEVISTLVDEVLVREWNEEPVKISDHEMSQPLLFEF
jgi:DNA (cytosine-5)-methyltransferase 1